MDLLVDESHCGRDRYVLESGHLKTAFKIIERVRVQTATNGAVLPLLIRPCCGPALANALSALPIKAPFAHSRQGLQGKNAVTGCCAPCQQQQWQRRHWRPICSTSTPMKTVIN